MRGSTANGIGEVEYLCVLFILMQTTTDAHWLHNATKGLVNHDIDAAIEIICTRPTLHLRAV